MLALRLWLLLLLLSPALATGEPLRLAANPWPPFTDQTLPANGLASELVAQALRRAGYETSYTELPWQRALLGFQHGDYDVLVGAWYSAERAEFGYFSQPYLVNRIRFLQNKGAATQFEKLADLYSHSIAVVRGYAYDREFDTDQRLRKVGVSSFVSAMRMLHARRVQLTLEDELVARYHLNRELLNIRDELEFLPLPLSENGLHMLVRRSHPQHREIVERFDRAIQAMHEDGSYAAIFTRHGF